jgi:hypothetical protein
MSRQAALWLLAAVAGIVIAAGITWATSQITSQHIGISSEPLSAADQLAPAETEGADRGRPGARHHIEAAPGPSISGLAPQAPRSSGDDGSAEGEADESGGGGGGRGSQEPGASQGRDD